MSAAFNAPPPPKRPWDFGHHAAGAISQQASLGPITREHSNLATAIGDVCFGSVRICPRRIQLHDADARHRLSM
jgi:hypothetical protein